MLLICSLPPGTWVRSASGRVAQLVEASYEYGYANVFDVDDNKRVTWSPETEVEVVPAPSSEPERAQDDPPAVGRPKRERGTSSCRNVIYRAWKDGETDVVKLAALVNGAVKVATVKAYTDGWRRGFRVPEVD